MGFFLCKINCLCNIDIKLITDSSIKLCCLLFDFSNLLNKNFTNLIFEMYKCFNILIIYLINLWYNLSQNLNFQKYFFEGDKSSHYVENVFSQYPIVTPSYCRILFVKTFIFFPRLLLLL